MQRGGYQILDLKNVPLKSGSAHMFEGIYELVEGTRKATLISGLNVGGVEYHDIFVNFSVVGQTYYGFFNITKDGSALKSVAIKIENTNAVTVTVEA